MDAFEIPTLMTERLRLRAFRGSDFEDYAALRTDSEVLRYLDCGPQPWDRSRSWRHMAFLIGHWQLSGSGMWALEQRETGAFLGFVGFAAPAGWPGFELAWTLMRCWWGHGYATEAARAALAHAFTVWHKDRIISLIHPENRASIRVAERIGETLQGRLQHLDRDMLCYGIDRESYVLGQRAGAAGSASGELRTKSLGPLEAAGGHRGHDLGSPLHDRVPRQDASESRLPDCAR